MTPRPLLILALSCLSLRAATPPAEVIPLWKDGAPGFESRRNIPEQAKDYWVRDINNPSVTVFRPQPGKANGCAVVVAPGGGFRELVYHAEGEQAADALTPLGVTVFVLKYRLYNAPGSPYSAADTRADALRALRLVRHRAADFGIDPHRIGMLGFSAGGALEMMVAFSPTAGDSTAVDPIDRESAHPDFLMVVYPGEPKLVPAVLPADAPPALLVCANDDDYGCDAVALALLERYRAAKVPVEAYFIAQGRHAFNMGDRSRFLSVRHWPDRMADWMADRGFLSPRP
jgi:acetyl esterase/lipase